MHSQCILVEILRPAKDIQHNDHTSVCRYEGQIPPHRMIANRHILSYIQGDS